MADMKQKGMCQNPACKSGFYFILFFYKFIFILFLIIILSNFVM